MIALLNHAVVTEPKPTFVITLRDVNVRREKRHHRSILRLASYRVGMTPIASQGGRNVAVLTASKASEAPFLDHPGLGNLRFLPRPNGHGIAALFTDERNAVRRVDVWDAHPLRRVASIACGESVRIDWLPSGASLAVVERGSAGYTTRIVSARGADQARLARTIGVIADPTSGTIYAVRHSSVAARTETLLTKSDGGQTLSRAIRAGDITFVQLSQRWRLGKTLRTEAAARTLLGRGAGLDALAGIAPPDRPLGFARNWAIVRAGALGDPHRTGVALVYDQLGYPKAKARFVRADTDDWNMTHSVSSGGTLLYSSSEGTDGYRIPGEAGDHFAATIRPDGKRYWLIRGVDKSIRSVVLWSE